MDKIAIITLNGYHNYGNRLQNYAMQEVLKDLGFTVETLVINLDQNNNLKQYNLIDKLKNITLDKIYNKILTYTRKDIINKREQVFKKFTNEFIVEKKYDFVNNDVLSEIRDEYDHFIIGSDQVWNPIYINKLPIYFLTFIPKNKKISYAASFGVNKIPAEYLDKYSHYLQNINRISVREETGANIVKELTGRHTPVLVDPTMLLTKEKWLSISKEDNNKPKEKYLLTYFLGDVSYEYKKTIRRIAKEKNLKIVHLASIKAHKNYIAGPSEFIDYINSASVLCTDSFHGCVFSILMKTPFIVFERIGSQSMYSRIDTLLSKFRLEFRKAEYIQTNDQIFECDYSHIPSILQNEREKAFDYLKEALNIQ